MPPGFVRVIEWALLPALAVVWASGAAASVLARLAAACVFADRVRICVGESATSVVRAPSRDFAFYDWHRFAAGELVNGVIATVWIALLGAGCVSVLRDR